MPKKLTDRHLLVSYMTAAGRSRQDVADATGFSESYLATLAKSPMFKHQLSKVRSSVRDKAVNAIVEQLQERTVGEADGALDTLIELMDGARNENVRLGAANSVLDRAVPKQTKHEEEKTIRISIDGEMLDRMSNVIQEVNNFSSETIDADFALKGQHSLEGVISDGHVQLTSIEELASVDELADSDEKVCQERMLAKIESGEIPS